MPPRPRQAGKFRRRRRRSGTRLAAGRETESVGAAARQDSGRKHQEARLQALSAEDRALPYRGGGQHLAWTKNQPTAKCWRCGYKVQARGACLQELSRVSRSSSKGPCEHEHKREKRQAEERRGAAERYLNSYPTRIDIGRRGAGPSRGRGRAE